MDQLGVHGRNHDDDAGRCRPAVCRLAGVRKPADGRPDPRRGAWPGLSSAQRRCPTLGWPAGPVEAAGSRAARRAVASAIAAAALEAGGAGPDTARRGRPRPARPNTRRDQTRGATPQDHINRSPTVLGDCHNLTRWVGDRTVDVRARPGPELDKVEREVAAWQRFQALVEAIAAVSEAICGVRPVAAAAATAGPRSTAAPGTRRGSSATGARGSPRCSARSGCGGPETLHDMPAW